MFICLSFFGCSILLLTDETAHVSFEHTDKLLVVIEKNLYPSLEQTLYRYVMDLEDEGSTVEITLWSGGAISDLKNILESSYVEKDTGGALLVGNLPSFWYEQHSFGSHEEFPSDLYFMDFDAQ